MKDTCAAEHASVAEICAAHACTAGWLDRTQPSVTPLITSGGGTWIVGASASTREMNCEHVFRFPASSTAFQMRSIVTSVMLGGQFPGCTTST